MILLSIGTGVLFGAIWGMLFTKRTKHVSSTSSWFLASSGVIRYILLAALLVLLMAKCHLKITWWAAGFLPSFWLLLMRSVRASEQEEDNA